MICLLFVIGLISLYQTNRKETKPGEVLLNTSEVLSLTGKVIIPDSPQIQLTKLLQHK